MEGVRVLHQVAGRTGSPAALDAARNRLGSAGAKLAGPAEGDSADCRAGCGACCIAPSISSPIPGMPDGKAAGVRCIHLTPDLRCAIFGLAERPAVCSSLRALVAMCGSTEQEALDYLTDLECETRPAISGCE